MIVDPENSPIIVFGAPRSGTTYLAEILNQHPEVAISNEIRLMVWAHNVLNILTQQDEMVYNERLELTAYLQKKLPNLLREFYREIRPGAKYWGDKNPHYAAPQHQGCLETVTSLFSGAHFIHIIRDGRDVISSIMRMGWADFDDAHEYWKNQLDTGCAFGQTQPGEKYLEVRYEELVREDAAIAEKIFAFLGIEMHPAVTGFCVSQQTTRVPIGFPTRDFSAGITRSTWAELLTAEQQLRSLDLIGEHLIRHGYESPTSLGEKQQRLAGLAANSAPLTAAKQS
jgi:hypothetical protein